MFPELLRNYSIASATKFSRFTSEEEKIPYSKVHCVGAHPLYSTQVVSIKLS